MRRLSRLRAGGKTGLRENPSLRAKAERASTQERLGLAQSAERSGYGRLCGVFALSAAGEQCGPGGSTARVAKRPEGSGRCDSEPGGAHRAAAGERRDGG